MMSSGAVLLGPRELLRQGMQVSPYLASNVSFPAPVSVLIPGRGLRPQQYSPCELRYQPLL